MQSQKIVVINMALPILTLSHRRKWHMTEKIFFPPEWHIQSGVQIAWPHANSDWKPYLDEAEKCFTEIARQISKREKLLIAAPDISVPRAKCSEFDDGRILYAEIPTNDTWSRDFGAITTFQGSVPVINDFAFNGWGLKFASNLDNRITGLLYEKGLYGRKPIYKNLLNFILEGGSVESDGNGTVMTTSECLLSPNRNGGSSMEEIEASLKGMFGTEQILWLNHGYLAGDDTDSHIDTLARFCPDNTICYVKCTDETDEHYESLKKMEEELSTFRNSEGQSYKLVAIPMADAVYFEGERLPATYANFLVINGAVLCPTYNSPKDTEALNIMKRLFPGREITGIDCSVLIKQHGSLHCVTMQYPEGVIE